MPRPTRLVRMDDYPYGRPGYDPEWCLRTVCSVLDILNRHGVSYLLGVIPECTTEGEAGALCGHLAPNGRVCMHGFNHGFNLPHWPHITKTWPEGGEFIGMDAEHFIARWVANSRRMQLMFGARYLSEHFIAPFNTYTQAVLDGLQSTQVMFLHTCDKEYNAYGYGALDHGHVTPVISQYHKTYDYADKVLAHLNNGSQLTLHWMFDVQNDNWATYYHALGRVLRERADS